MSWSSEARSFRPLARELRRWNPGADGGRGAGSLSISQGLDTDAANPTSRLLLHILAAVAEFERELIKERVSAGLKHAKAKGTRIGGPGACSTGSGRWTCGRKG